MLRLSILSSLMMILLLSGCVKYPDLYDAEREKDVSVTYYDKETDFSGFTTYSVVDVVGKVELEDDSLIIVLSENSTLILNSVNSNMSDMGFTKVDSASDPDLFTNIHVLNLSIKYIDLPGGYWDWGYYWDYDPYYYGSPYYWGYPGYSYYYPYDYPYYYTSTYGSILIEIIDRKNLNEGSEKFKVVWTGIVTGTTNSSSSIDTRITDGIDELFNQSQYMGN